MSEKELRKSIAETQKGAAAIGICIARALAEVESDLVPKILVHAKKLQKHLQDNERPDAATVLFSFTEALEHPGSSPLFKTD